MRNIVLTSILLISFFYSCSDDDTRVNCEEKEIAINFSEAAFSENPSVETCISYKNALLDAINNNCGDTAQLQVKAESLDCSAENF